MTVRQNPLWLRKGQRPLTDFRRCGYDQVMVAFIGTPGPWQVIIVSLIAILLLGYRLPGLMQQLQDRYMQPLRPRRRRAEPPPPENLRVSELLQVYLATVLVMAMHFALSPVLALSFSVVLVAIVLSKI